MLTAIEGFHHPSYIEPDEEYRQQRIDYTLAALETASDLGLPYISIEPGGLIPDGKSREWAMDTFVESPRKSSRKPRQSASTSPSSPNRTS